MDKQHLAQATVLIKQHSFRNNALKYIQFYANETSLHNTLKPAWRTLAHRTLQSDRCQGDCFIHEPQPYVSLGAISALA